MSLDRVQIQTLIDQITQNTNQSNTGQIVHDLLEEMANSAIFISERFSSYFFPYIIEFRTNNVSPTATAGKYYIYDFTPVEAVEASVIALDIVHWSVSNNQWEKPTEYNNNISKDIIGFFNKRSVADPVPCSYFKRGIDYQQNLSPKNVWIDAGKIQLVHNYLHGIEGTGPEFIHLNQTQLTFFETLSVSKLSFLDDRVLKVGSYTAVPVTGNIVIYNNVVQEYNGSSWQPYSIIWDTSIPGWNPPKFNYIVLNEDDNHNWIYDYKNGVFVDMGINIHFNHNSGFGKQGGTTDEFYHLTAAAAVISERFISRIKFFGKYSVKSYLGNTALPSTGNTIDDIYLREDGVWQCSALPNTWVKLIDTVNNIEYYFIADDDKKTYISNIDNSAFYSANQAKLWDHDSQLEVNGPGPEKLHVNQVQMDTINSIESGVLEQHIYINSSIGDDTNDGTVSHPVKTEVGIISVLIGKKIILHLPEGDINLVLGSNLIDKMILKGCHSLAIESLLDLNLENNVAITQHASGKQLYEFDADESGKSFDNDLASGKFFISTFPMRGTDIIKETTVGGFATLVVNKDIGATFSGDISKITSKVTINAVLDNFNISVSANNIEVVFNPGISGMLSMDNKFTNSLLKTDLLYSKTYFEKSSLTNYSLNNSITITGEITYDDLMIMTPATVGSGLSTGNIINYNSMKGVSLLFYGFETIIKSKETSIVEVDDFLTITGFVNIIDFIEGGKYNFQTINTLIGSTLTFNPKTFLIKSSTKMECNKDVDLNILDFKETSIVDLDYYDFSSSKNIFYYKRNSDNINILYSELEKGRSLYVEDFTSLGTTHKIKMLRILTCKSVKLDIYIENITDGEFQQSSVNIATSGVPPADAIMLDGGTNAGAGNVVISSITIDSENIVLEGLTNAKNYIVQIDIKRFFF